MHGLVGELNKNKQLAPVVESRDAAHSDVNKTSHLPTLASVKFLFLKRSERKRAWNLTDNEIRLSKLISLLGK